MSCSEVSSRHATAIALAGTVELADRVNQPLGEQRLVRQARRGVVIGEMVALRFRLLQRRDVHPQAGDPAVAHAPLGDEHPASVGELFDDAPSEFTVVLKPGRDPLRFLPLRIGIDAALDRRAQEVLERHARNREFGDVGVELAEGFVGHDDPVFRVEDHEAFGDAVDGVA